MIDELRDPFETLLARRDVDEEAMCRAVGAVMDGRASEPELAALLVALRMKGEAVSEIVGAARAMAQRATAIPSARSGLLDTCGTGGDRLHTFNISTTCALVAAACGVPVAKHGNRSVSSSSGSADVLEALGVDITLGPALVGRCVDELGIGFCFAPLVHGAMRHAVPVRRALGVRTVFNLLGPLTNPAGADFQLVGTFDPHTARLLAESLLRLGRKRAVVVCGAGQLDEVALWGETTAHLVANGRIETLAWTPADFGLPTCDVAALRATSAQDSAATIRRILDGAPGPQRDVVVANTAAALFAAGAETDLRRAAARARGALDSAAPRDLLARLAAWTKSAAAVANG